jgi:ribosomal protein S18 acetylase RimI-like enzyme
VDLLRLAVLTPQLEDIYWRFVKQDYGDYYFFIYDLILQPQKSKVWLALEGEQILGLMLVYDGYMVQLRGNPVAVGALLTGLDLEHLELNAPIDCENEVLSKFPVYSKKETLTLMVLDKGKENLPVTTKVERLGEADFGDVAALMRDSYPAIWSDMTAENVKHLTSPEGTVLFGVKREGKLVAFGSTILSPKIGHVMWLATDKQWRNRGFATSILSTLIQENLNKADKTIIYVMDDNPAAKQLYSKMGFAPYKTYLFLKT